MRVLVCGSRGFPRRSMVEWELDQLKDRYPKLVIVEGCCLDSPDQWAEEWAVKNNIPIEHFPVTKEEWKDLGKKAGHIRNLKMIQTRPNGMLAFRYRLSKGTSNTLDHAKEFKIPSIVYDMY